jgi:hypothetical protein
VIGTGSVDGGTQRCRRANGSVGFAGVPIESPTAQIGRQ